MQFQIPAFAIDVNRGKGSLRFDRKLSLPPDLSMELHEIQLSLSDDGVQFGPSAWKIDYAEYNGAGTAEGQLKWTPALATELSFSTDPLTIRQWKQIRASGKVNFDKGILKITDFRAQQGQGEFLASAEISDKKKSVIAAWKRLELGPAGIPANSNGTVSLQWNASDFSDTQRCRICRARQCVRSRSVGDRNSKRKSASPDFRDCSGHTRDCNGENGTRQKG